MTLSEKRYAMKRLPPSSWVDISAAAYRAEVWWGSDGPAAVMVAKAAAIELALICNGALEVLAAHR